MMDISNKPFHYTGCGLDYIYLCNGVDLKERNGKNYYKIQEVDSLHDCIAHKIALSPNPLRGMELRFLRTLLGLSQSALATSVGRGRDVIARAEGLPDAKVNGPLDRVVRFLYLIKKEAPDEMNKLHDLMDDIAEQNYRKEVDLQFEDGWSVNEKKCA